MTCIDIANFACETTGDISSDALAYAKTALRLKYQTLYDAHNWREAMRVKVQPLDPTLGGVFFLPYDAEEVVSCSLSYDGASYVRLMYRERDWIERFYSPLMTLPGNTPWFYRAENLAWPYSNPGHFTFTTSEKSSFQAYIAGTDSNGFQISESFILQGAPQSDGSALPVSIGSANAYAQVTSLSKSVTETPLLIQAQLPTSPVTMPAGASEFVFSQFVLYPPPNFTAGQTLYLRTQVKLKADTLDNDMSVPRISHIWDALICFTTGALWKRGKQLQKGKAEETDAMEHIKAAINVEKNQSEMRQQVVPAVYERGNYMDGRYEHATSYNPFGGW
jgi:hypothetical protein